MTDKLLPCPFCGETGPVGVFNENQLNYVSKSDKNYKENPYYAVVCDITVCGCGGSGGFRRSPKEAILAWNNRVLTKGGE